jgi:hypothetical protein
VFAGIIILRRIKPKSFWILMLRSIIILFLFLSFGCASQHQGIMGKVEWISGNQMPGPTRQDRNPASGIVREVYAYKAVTAQQTTQSNGFYTEIRSPLIAKATSNADGTFTLKLPPGEYSVFTKEPEGLFASIMDGNGRINVVSVKKRQYSEITIKVNYTAVY